MTHSSPEHVRTKQVKVLFNEQEHRLLALFSHQSKQQRATFVREAVMDRINLLLSEKS